MALELNYINDTGNSIIIRDFLKQQGLPRNFIKAVKFNGGKILLDDVEVTVRKMMQTGDKLTLIPPIETGHDTVISSDLPIEIVYEDRDVLVINKPWNCVSIPSIQNPDSSIANRVKGYYESQGYANQVIHIVTRLDRDTSGLMLIAKHRLAHAFLDQGIQEGLVERYYYALSHSQSFEEHGFIEAPIARNPESIISRIVDPSGQYAKTEYWLQQALDSGSLIRLRLHTGRTHQIRVHMAHIHSPLVGDDLYGGKKDDILQRQALHCGEIEFPHPFTGEMMRITADLPADMSHWIQENKRGD